MVRCTLPTLAQYQVQLLFALTGWYKEAGRELRWCDADSRPRGVWYYVLQLV
jgi:hypothetical protein